MFCVKSFALKANYCTQIVSGRLVLPQAALIFRNYIVNSYMKTMRLIDLKPRWIGLNQWASESIFTVGVSFLCPHCNPNLPEHGENRRRRLAVKFWPPIDPDGLLGKMFDIPNEGYHRRISGDSFGTLTIEPSIGFDSIGHWHGYITNGEIR